MSANIVSTLSESNGSEETKISGLRAPNRASVFESKAPEKKAFSSHLNQQGKALIEQAKPQIKPEAKAQTPDQPPEKLDELGVELIDIAPEQPTENPLEHAPSTPIALALNTDEEAVAQAVPTVDAVPVLAVVNEDVDKIVTDDEPAAASTTTPRRQHQDSQPPALPNIQPEFDKTLDAKARAARLEEHPFQTAKSQLKDIGRQLDKGSAALTLLGEPKASALEPLKVEAVGSSVQANSANAKGLGYPMAGAFKPAQAVQLNAQVQSKQWAPQFSQKITWMVKQNVQQANIRLNPANLGPIEIKISTQNDQTSVSFSAHHALTRDAIEQALPRLKEMMAESGLNLAESEVSKESFSGEAERERQARSMGSSDGSSGQAQGDAAMGEEEVADPPMQGEIGVDYFA